MIPPFSAPVYEPAPYAYCGRAFHELPPLAQHYLSEVACLMPPATHSPSAIEDERSRLALSLFRALQGIDIALVDKRYEAYHVAREAQASPTTQWFHSALRKDEERLQEVVGVLLPERQRTLDEFMIKFDALVWLDGEGREQFSHAEWQAHRDTLCAPILDYTRRALIALDESVMKKTIELQENSQAQPDPYRYLNWEKVQTDTEAKVERRFREIRNSPERSPIKGRRTSVDYGPTWHSCRKGRFPPN